MAVIKTLILLFCIVTILKLFFMHSILGRTFLLVIKDLILLVKLNLKIIKYTLKHSYILINKLNKFLQVQVNKFDKKNKTQKKSNGNKDTKKKVVNGENNIIDINNYKNKSKNKE